jgi:hypothetical protein
MRGKSDSGGPGVLRYVLVIALIVVAVIAALILLGPQTSRGYPGPFAATPLASPPVGTIVSTP